MRNQLLAATSAAALLLLGAPARASTIVATIIGAYDSNCSSGNSYCGLVNGTTIQNYATNGGGQSDTPNLFILNPNSTAMTGVSLTLTGYQDAAGGTGNGSTFSNSAPNPAVTVLDLPDIAPNTVYQLIWANTGGGVSVQSATGQTLFQSDYDDELGGALSNTYTDSLGHHCLSGSGTSTGLCSFVGNFDVSFGATLSGSPIAANFSPDNTQGGGNVAGSFVPWEGLDANGLSETYADAHTNSFPGTLAVITTGTSGSQNVPEPASLTLLGGGLTALGLARRRRKSR